VGNWVNTALIHNKAKTKFPNRLKDDYSNPASCGQVPSWLSPVTHFGGYRPLIFADAWDNMAVLHNAAVAGVAATTNNTTLIQAAKRHFEEWLRVAVFPDGTVWDQARWTTSSPGTGWEYASAVFGAVITTADHVARTGDTELFTYSTSLGTVARLVDPNRCSRC
jgi:hypothetical protein